MDVLVLLLIALICKTIPLVPSVGFDLSTGRDMKSFLYCCVLKKVEGRGRRSAAVSLHWISVRTFLIGGFSCDRC